MRTVITAPANPGNSGTAVVYDSDASPDASAKALQKAKSRIRVAIYVDQAVTLNVLWAAPGSTNLRTAVSFPVVASTYFQRDILLQPGRTKITIVNGGTAPTTWEIGVEAVADQAVGQ